MELEDLHKLLDSLLEKRWVAYDIKGDLVIMAPARRTLVLELDDTGMLFYNPDYFSHIEHLTTLTKLKNPKLFNDLIFRWFIKKFPKYRISGVHKGFHFREQFYDETMKELNELGTIINKSQTNEQMKDIFKKNIDTAFTSASSETGTSPSDMASASFKLQGELKNGETAEATGAGAAGGFSGPLGGETKEEKIKGGLSSSKTLADIAKKHKVSVEILKSQLSKGIKVEMEHTDDKKIAREIAMDHLYENPKYYTKLKKIEATEATGASSAGQYSGPAFLAKSTSKKDWRGASKTQIPGGKFVQVKKKCKTFPYCNQGDINSLKIFENETLKRVIKLISEKHNISETVIKNIIVEEFSKKRKTNK